MSIYQIDACFCVSVSISNAFVPISSPRYITVVGGTDFAVKSTIGDEKAWTDGGGGFSDTFLAPAYVWRAITECEFYMFLKSDSVFGAHVPVFVR